MTQTPFEITRPATWPTALLEAVAEIDARTPHADYPSDLRVPAEAAGLLWDVLPHRYVFARHFTRLLPHEFDSIRRDGLCLHERALFDHRIDAARAHGFLQATIAERLKVASIPAAEHGRRGQRDFGWMTVGPSSEERPASVGPLHNTWGGDGLYFATGTQSLLCQRLLKDLGQPVAVHVALPLADTSTLRFWPALENLLLGTVRGLPHVRGDASSSRAISASSILGFDELN